MKPKNQSLVLEPLRRPRDILVMGGTNSGKIFLNVLCSEAATILAACRRNSSSIFRKEECGGKPDFATGGGKDNGQLETILDELRSEPGALKNY